MDIHQEGRSQRSAPQRTHTAHLRRAPTGHSGNQAAGTREVIKMHSPPGTVHSSSTCLLRCSDPGMAQNTCPTESMPLWSTQEPEPEQLRPGKCTKPRACFGEFPCTATWSLSSVDWKSTHAVSGGKPSMASHCEHSPHMPVIFDCSVPPSLQHN